MAHDVQPLRYFQRDRQLLLDQQDGNAAPRDLVEQAGDLLDELGRQPFGRFVDDDEIGVSHQRAAHGEHLLLAARQDAGLVGLAFAEVGKQAEHVVEGPAAELAGALQSQFEVLLHRQGGKDLAVLRHIAQSGVGDLVGPQAGDRPPLEAHLALRADQAHDRLAGRRSPDTIAAEQAHDLALADRQVDTLQDVALAIVGVQSPHLEHRGLKHHAASVPR